ncbi:MAG: hypothetical protein ABI408_07435 [Gemmatimonadaceae bacterium]
MSGRFLYLMGIAAVIGCAASAANPGDPTAVPRMGSVLSAEEMTSAHADINSAYDAVARLRPNWLAPHGSMSSNSAVSPYAMVFVDDQLVGDVNALRNIQAYQVGDIRYYDVTQAGARFGVRAGTMGAIEVLLKSPTRR